MGREYLVALLLAGAAIAVAVAVVPLPMLFPNLSRRQLLALFYGGWGFAAFFCVLAVAVAMQGENNSPSLVPLLGMAASGVVFLAFTAWFVLSPGKPAEVDKSSTPETPLADELRAEGAAAQRTAQEAADNEAAEEARRARAELDRLSDEEAKARFDEFVRPDPPSVIVTVSPGQININNRSDRDLWLWGSQFEGWPPQTEADPRFVPANDSYYVLTKHAENAARTILGANGERLFNLDFFITDSKTRRYVVRSKLLTVIANNVVTFHVQNLGVEERDWNLDAAR